MIRSRAVPVLLTVATSLTPALVQAQDCPDGPSSSQREQPAITFPGSVDDLADIVETALLNDGFVLSEASGDRLLVTAPNFDWPDLAKSEGRLGEVRPGVIVRVELVSRGDSTTVQATSQVVCKLPEVSDAEDIIAALAAGHLMVVVGDGVSAKASR